MTDTSARIVLRKDGNIIRGSDIIGSWYKDFRDFGATLLDLRDSPWFERRSDLVAWLSNPDVQISQPQSGQRAITTRRILDGIRAGTSTRAAIAGWAYNVPGRMTLCDDDALCEQSVVARSVTRHPVADLDDSSITGTGYTSLQDLIDDFEAKPDALPVICLTLVDLAP